MGKVIALQINTHKTSGFAVEPRDVMEFPPPITDAVIEQRANTAIAKMKGNIMMMKGGVKK